MTPSLRCLVWAAIACLAMCDASAVARTVPDDDRPLQVVDADGKVVGRYVAGPAVVAIVEGVRVQLPLKAGPLVGNDYTLTWGDTGANLQFSSNDCRGPAYLFIVGATPPGTRFAILSATGASALLYIPASLEKRLIQGRSESELVGGACIVGSFADGATIGIAVDGPPIDLGARFRLPLMMR